MPIEPFDFTYSLSSQSVQNEALNALGKNRVKEYEPKSYFFTESTLTAQVDSQGAYGPVDENKFNITTQFQLANKKAYAVTSGQVLIVPQTGTGNESKVNVFIKPLKNVDVGVPIKYYIYRGLKKELFVDSNNNIVPKNTSNTPFMAKVWTDLINHNKLTEPLPQIPASLFGYTTTETNTNSLDAKFFNTYDSTITDETKVYNLAMVEAGQYFGDFKDDKGGFEIVLNDGFYYQEKSDTGFQFDLTYAKSEKIVLDVADIADEPSISEKIYRENVQNFLDPAAFYGAHITEKEKGEIHFIDSNTKYSTRADIFNNVVNKFYNKYKCYIYLQGNKGRSFNFDETLGTEPLKIGISEVVTPSSYQTNGWPIIISEFEQTHSDDENDTKKKLNDLSFQLKFKTLDKNITLYNTYGNCTNEAIEGNFLSNTALLDKANIATQVYTNNVNYKLINNYNLNGGSLITKNIATFIYINHDEKEVEYFNDFFGPINIEPILKVNDGVSNSIIQKVINKKSKIKYKDGSSSVYNQGLVIKGKNTASPSPVDPEDTRSRLYVLKKTDSTNNEDRTFNQFLSPNSGYSYANTKEEYGEYVYGDRNYTVWKGQFPEGIDLIDTLQLINFQEESNVTNFMQLGITETDFNKLIYNNETIILDSDHIPAMATNLFFHLDDSGVTQDPNNTFKKYKLGIKYQSYNLTGPSEVIVYPSISDIFVYTIDGNYFFTKEFSKNFKFAEVFGNGIMNFVTQNDYAGEFGFDWLRLNTPSYKDSIVSGYELSSSWTDPNLEYDSSTEAFEALKKEYIGIKTNKEDEIYYVSYLNIYPQNAIGTSNPPSTVKLRGELTLEPGFEKISYEYDTNIFSVTSNPPPQNIDLNKFDQPVNFVITCIKEFDKDQIIKVIAKSKNLDEIISSEKVIGVIKVCKNSKQANIKNLKVVLVQVKTDVNNNGSIDTDPLYPAPEYMSIDEKNRLKNTLYQSLVYADISIASPLDMSNDPKFQKGGDDTYYTKVKANGKEVEEEYLVDDQRIQNYLIAKLKEEQPQYNNHLKVFVFAVNGISGAGTEVGGRANGIGSRSCAMYKKRPPGTLPHEVLHAIGLYHTHADGQIDNPRQKYIYPKYNDNPALGPVVTSGTTDNIMSYTLNGQITTWKWQWKIIKSILNEL